MFVAQSLDTDDDGPATKRLKTGTEDAFPYGYANNAYIDQPLNETSR